MFENDREHQSNMLSESVSMLTLSCALKTCGRGVFVCVFCRLSFFVCFGMLDPDLLATARNCGILFQTIWKHLDIIRHVRKPRKSKLRENEKCQQIFASKRVTTFSPKSFPATGVLADLLEGPVVIGHSPAAKYRRPFAFIYMTW